MNVTYVYNVKENSWSNKKWVVTDSAPERWSVTIDNSFKHVGFKCFALEEEKVGLIVLQSHANISVVLSPLRIGLVDDHSEKFFTSNQFEGGVEYKKALCSDGLL